MVEGCFLSLVSAVGIRIAKDQADGAERHGRPPERGGGFNAGKLAKKMDGGEELSPAVLDAPVCGAGANVKSLCLLRGGLHLLNRLAHDLLRTLLGYAKPAPDVNVGQPVRNADSI